MDDHELPNDLDTPPGMEGVAEQMRKDFMLETSSMWITGAGTPWPYPVELE